MQTSWAGRWWRKARRAMVDLQSPARRPATIRSWCVRSQRHRGPRARWEPDGGRSSGSSSGSLNFDQNQNGEARRSTLQATGAHALGDLVRGRLGNGVRRQQHLRQSARHTASNAKQNEWLFAGQGRGGGASGQHRSRRSNIHTNRDAENPSVAGGATGPGNHRVPWVAWEEVRHSQHEQSAADLHQQGGQADQWHDMSALDGANPAKPVGGAAINGFWQQVGIDHGQL